MPSKKAIISIIVAIVLVILGIIFTAGCVSLSDSSQDSSDTSHSSLVIIDTDPGIDDSVAIFLQSKIIGDPDIYVATVGNVSSDILQRNTMTILDYLNYKGIPSLGAQQKLDGSKAYYDGFSGEDGMGNTIDDFLLLASEKYDFDLSKEITQEEKEIARGQFYTMKSPSEIASYIEDYDSITYIILGPLTTLATLITAYPEIKNKINHVYVMGGGFEVTNAPNETEFNIACDPLAAEIVLSSGLDITLFPLDATIKCYLTYDDIQKLKETGNYPEIIKILEYGLAKSLETNEGDGFQMHDPMTVLYQKYPEWYTIEDAKVTIDEYGHLEKSDDGYPIHVVTGIDTSKLIEIMKKAFKS